MTSSRSQPAVRRCLDQRRGSRGVALLVGLLLLSGLPMLVSEGAVAAGEMATASVASVASDAPDAVAAPVQLADAELLVHDSPFWDDSALNYLDQPDGQEILYECRADLAGVAVWVYGTDVYSADSQVCYAAVHAGVITLDDGGPVVIEMGPPAPTYVGSTRNGITSEDDDWPDGRSFVVLDADDVELPPEYQDLPAGRLVVDHTELDLGTVAVGGSASATLTVRNDGDGALTVHEVALDEHLSGQFHVRDDTVTTSPLAPGEERTLEVEFAPTSAATGPPRFVESDVSLHGSGTLLISYDVGQQTVSLYARNLGGPGTVAYAATCGMQDQFTDRTTGSWDGSIEALAGAHYRIAVTVATSGSARESWVRLALPQELTLGTVVQPMPPGVTVSAYLGIEEVDVFRLADAALLLRSDEPRDEPDPWGPSEPEGTLVSLFGTPEPVGPPQETEDPGEQEGTFTDVDPASTHAAAIERAAALGLTLGVSAEPPMFAPSASVRRDQAASFVARLLEHGPTQLPDAAPAGFTDLVGNVHAGAIDRLAAVDIVRGAADDTYAPSAPVTRAQMTSLLIRALRWSTQQPLEAAGGPYFSDVDGVHADNIDAAHELGLAAGRTDGTFGPGLDIRRDQMASLLVRAYDHLVVEG